MNAKLPTITSSDFLYVAPYLDRSVRHIQKEKHIGRILLSFLNGYYIGNSQDPTEYWEGQISAGNVTVRGHASSKDEVCEPFRPALSYKLQKQDTVSIISHVHPRFIDFRSGFGTVLLWNDEFLVINKPAGMVVQGAKPELWLEHWRNHVGRKVIPLHRLDEQVSGVMICAFRSSQKRARKLLSHPETGKIYHARVSGLVDFDERVVRVGMRWNAEGRRAELCPEGKPTISVLKLIRHCDDGSSLVQVRIRTGFRHQIRAHLSSLGHPILNDTKYGGELIGQPWVGYEPSEELLEFYMQHSVPWCQKCTWVQNLLTNEDSERPSMGPRIWLHAYEYSLANSISVRAPLPTFLDPD